MPSALSNNQPVAAKSKPKKALRKTSGEPVQRHTVQPGETLNSIASIHHTTVDALKRDNGNLAMLRPGMILVIRGR
jgi:LysM repeat protein